MNVPEGWLVYETSDYSGDPDEDGNYPVDPTSIGLIKGGTSALDALTNPTIYIYYESGDAETQVEYAEVWYDEVTEIESDVNGGNCKAIEAKSADITDEDQFYVYDIIYYDVDDENCIQITVPVDMIEYEAVSLTDPDVIEIINSVVMD